MWLDTRSFPQEYKCCIVTKSSLYRLKWQFFMAFSEPTFNIYKDLLKVDAESLLPEIFVLSFNMKVSNNTCIPWSSIFDFWEVNLCTAVRLSQVFIADSLLLCSTSVKNYQSRLIQCVYWVDYLHFYQKIIKFKKFGNNTSFL